MQIYTMPQAFMEDTNVAVKWRLYGLINGFWNNHRTVYASNKYFAELLKCDERSVRRALEELDKMGIIRRVIDGHSREILPGGRVLVEEDAQRPTPGLPESYMEDAQRPPNASSNASNINTADADFHEIQYVKFEDSDFNDLVPKKKSAPATKEYERGLRWAEERTGRKFVNRTKQYAALKKAKANGITEAELVRRWRELEGEDFYQKNGLDWQTVVNSFDRKR